MKSLSVRLGVILIELIILGYGCLLANAQSTLALQEKCAEGDLFYETTPDPYDRA